MFKIGVVSSLNLPNYCYNKNIQYFNLNNKILYLDKDIYAGLYSRNCFDRYTKSNNDDNLLIYSNLTSFVSDVIQNATTSAVVLTGLYPSRK